MPSRQFAIGDIHGCLLALDTLLSSLQLDASDQLIFLGDYIDRGPDSRGVLERMLKLERAKRHVFLRGNHEAWMLKARTDAEWLRSWWDVGGQETVESYDALTLKGIPRAHWAFLERTKLFWEDERHIFVHGATTRDLPLEETPEPWLLWHRINDIDPHPSGKRVICGHAAQKSGRPLDRDFAVCIDTYAHGGGWLSALEVGSNELFQANEDGQTRRGTLDELGIKSK